MTHRVMRLVARPSGPLKDTDLEMCTEAKPVRGAGQLLLRNTYLSIDPTHRIWMSDKAQYMPAVELGDIMRSVSLAVVEESDLPDYPVGETYVCFGGVCEYFVGTPGADVLYKAGLKDLPITADLSVASIIIGLTAWHGINKILMPEKDSIVVVSGAAGAVGSLVGQLAKLRGAKVVGIAGGPTKCAWLKNELKFDCVIDYKNEDVEKAIAAYAPEGVECYYDNVGGRVSDAVLMNMKLNSKYALCGSISEYDDSWSGQVSRSRG